MQSVTITANDDGSFSVQGEAAPEMPEGGGQTFASAEEACDAAVAMLGGGEAAEPKMDGEEQFTQGFKQVRGTPDEQMAARMVR